MLVCEIVVQVLALGFVFRLLSWLVLSASKSFISGVASSFPVWMFSAGLKLFQVAQIVREW